MFIRCGGGRAVGVGVGLSRSESPVEARMEGEDVALLESFLRLPASLSQGKVFPVTAAATLVDIFPKG